MMNRKRRTPTQPHQDEGSSSGTKNERMIPVTEDEPCTTVQPSLDLISAVKELHVLSPDNLRNLIRDAENGIIKLTKGNGSCFQINMESLAKNLGIHLIAHVLSFKRDEEHLRYLLGGLKLLHTLHNLADCYSKLNEVLLDDVYSGEQMFDLTFFMIVFISRSGQEYDASNKMVLLHSALLASSFHLLTAFISQDWSTLTTFLLCHPKVDIFTRAAFSGVHMVTNFLKVKLLAQHTDTGMKLTVDEVHCLFQLYEASLQFLQSLCQQKLFGERLLNYNKELCEKGGVFTLVLDVMKLPTSNDFDLMAVVYRLKSKALSTMLHLCEVQSPSFLDMSCSTSHGLELAKSTVYEVFAMLKMMVCGDFKDYPWGILQLDAMRLIEIFSHDSRLRSHMIVSLTEVLTQVFLQPETTFLSTWCSSDDHPAEDVVMDFDSVSAAGHVLGVFSASFVRHTTLSTLQAPQILYTNQISSLLIKILANLIHFVPDLCKEEKDPLINKFLECLKREIPSGDVDRIDVVTRNLGSLLAVAGSLAPKYVEIHDVNHLRELISQLEQLISTQKSEMHRVKEVHDRGQCSTAAPQRRRNKMNDLQIAVIESALLQEPDMQRNPASLQHWANQLSTHGLEVTASQLKNWLNNRRAKLARAASKDALVPSGGDNTLTENQGGSGLDLIPVESPLDSTPQGTHSLLRICGPKTTKYPKQPGQYVLLVNEKGEEIGRGNIHLSRGVWFEMNLEELGLCVVDVTDLMVGKQFELPYPCVAGTTFAQAELILGKKRVLWDVNKILNQFID